MPGPAWPRGAPAARPRPKPVRAVADIPSSAAPSDKVDQRIQEDPDDIDEVPVEPGNLDRGVVGAGKSAAPRAHRHGAEQADADRDMKPVYPRQHEVQEVEQLHRLG